MESNSPGDTHREDLERLAHSIVSTWVAECSVTLRPRDRHTLKTIIRQSIEKHAECKTIPDRLTDIESLKEQERSACVEAIAGLKEDPFPGFVSKQRALNACYAASRSGAQPCNRASDPVPGTNMDKISARNIS